MAMFEQAQRLRDLVNRPRRLHTLVPDTPRWNEICSAMDTIDDTALALDAYEQLPPPSGKGACYLAIYGALQVLYVQQDAIRSLATALGQTYTPDSELVTIRNIRNASIGHPTRTRSGTSNILVQATLSHTHFELIEYSSDGGYRDRAISIPVLIAKQRLVVEGILRDVSQALVDEELAHRRQFRQRPLLAGFDQLPYAFEKLAEGIRDRRTLPIARWGLGNVRAVLLGFTKELVDRGIDNYDVYRHELPLIEDGLSRLHAELREDGDEHLAEILRYFVRTKFRELADVARETDDEYLSDEV